MLDALRQIIPSMFHRRLLLLAVVVVLCMTVLAAKTAHLTTGTQHTQRQEIIRIALERAKPTPTSRGSLRDRKRRLLAEDRPGWEITLSFPALSGHWAYVKARQAAERSVGKPVWRDLPDNEQEALADEYVLPYLQKLETLTVMLADFGDVRPQEIDAEKSRVVRWVQQMAAFATDNKRKSKLKKLEVSEADLTWADVYVEVAEEFQSHPALFNATDETVSEVQQFIALANIEDEQFARDQQEARDAGLPPPPDTREYDAWLEVTPQRVRQRSYPWESQGFVLDRSTFPKPLRSDTPLEINVEGIGRHVIGSLRRVNDDDPHWKRRPYSEEDRGGYRPQDLIGRGGIERSMESTLRGIRGERVIHLDTGEEQVIAPVAGQDVHLTLDIVLQMRVQALMSHDPAVGLMRSQEFHHAGDSDFAPRIGDPLNGAAIVMDVDNGEVLAAVSVPGVTLADFEKEGSVKLYADQLNVPWKARFVGGYQELYEPGSTNKPLVLAAAITDGIIGPDEEIDCTQGFLWDNQPNVFRDWIKKQYPTLPGFGSINGVEALTVSSNVFFGRLAQGFGEQSSLNRFVWWFSQFGFGRYSGSYLLEESPGVLPAFGPDDDVTESKAAYMSIGEGAMTASPMQVAAAHATLARGGLYISPTFVQPRSRPEDNPQTVYNLYLSPAACDRALRGMDRSANYTNADGAKRGTTVQIGYDNGTSEPVFNTPGVKVFAKSGTAEPPPLLARDKEGKILRDDEGKAIVARTGNHAWVVALVQPDGESKPTHAIACVVEYGGSGGRTAGPIVNQIIRALAVEGYLGETALQGVQPESATAANRTAASAVASGGETSR